MPSRQNPESDRTFNRIPIEATPPFVWIVGEMVGEPRTVFGIHVQKDDEGTFIDSAVQIAAGMQSQLHSKSLPVQGLSAVVEVSPEGEVLRDDTIILRGLADAVASRGVTPNNPLQTS